MTELERIRQKFNSPNAGYNLYGMVFGELKVIDYSGVDHRKERLWECVCSCGGSIVARSYDLRRGLTSHCGCRLGENISESLKEHGKTRTPIYYAWINMKTRCDNPNYELYHHYGGRGIRYCDSWKDSKKFIKWALENGYSDDLSLDRIDNDGNYEPSNCRWVTMQVQQNNRRNNRMITYNGVTDTMANWSRNLDINYNTLQTKLNRGMAMGEIVNDGT